MPEFLTDGPIDLSIDVPMGRLEVTASDRDDATVTITPSKPGRQGDIRVAAETAVAFANGRLTIVAPHRYLPFGGHGSIQVVVAVPAGSRLTADLAFGTLVAAGPLGATRIESSSGDVTIEQAERLSIRSTNGSITVGHVSGDLDLVNGNGSSRIDYAGGTVTMKASNGDIHVGVAGGLLSAKLANGAITIGEALDSVTARNAHGAIRIGEVSSGAIQVDTSLGEVEVGIRPGVAAWLDLASKIGAVHNLMDSAPAPAEGEGSVEVRVRTNFGEVRVGPAAKLVG